MARIIGGTATSSMLVPDWNQKNPNRADYIKNKPAVAPALIGSASGLGAIRIDDSSTLEHEMKVGLKSKNLANADAMLNANLTKDENGVYRLTKGGGAGFYFDETIPANTPFVISYENFEGYNANSDAYIYNALYFVDGTSQGGNWCGQGNFSNKIVVNPSKDVKGFNIYLYNPSADAYCSFTGVQVELGTTATAYTPYVDVNGATVNKCGKNLANVFLMNTSASISVNNEGTIVVKADTAQGGYLRNFCPNLKVGMTITIDATQRSGSQFYLYGEGKWHNWGESFLVTETILNSSVAFYCNKVNGASVTSEIVGFQIEIGTTATEHEAYKDPEPITAEEDGTVNGIIGNGDTVTLVADNGVTITAEYQKDINKAFAEIYQAIATMGAAPAVIPEEV